MESKKYSMDLAGRELTLEFGKYCEQAAGSVWVHLGDTVVMVNATMAPTPRPGVDFFPLAVDVEEKQYSVGKIPGGFIKREGRPTEKATLTCRLIDRPLRPLFNKGMRNDVQVVVTVLSVEQDVPPEIPAMIGSSIALAVSEIPWNGPTGAVVVGRVDGQYVINPGWQPLLTGIHVPPVHIRPYLHGLSFPATAHPLACQTIPVPPAIPYTLHQKEYCIL